MRLCDVAVATGHKLTEDSVTIDHPEPAFLAEPGRKSSCQLTQKATEVTPDNFITKSAPVAISSQENECVEKAPEITDLDIVNILVKHILFHFTPSVHDTFRGM